MNYSFPPRLKASDYSKSKITQDEIIALQISNDANIARARKAVRMGEVEQPTPLQVASPDELLMDVANLEANARVNLEKLGFRPQEAAQIITNIRNDPTLDFVTINTNFPSIEADVRKRFNVKLLTPTFFLDYLRKYSAELDGTTGMKIFNPNNMMVNTVDELRQVLPDPAVIEYLRRAAEEGRFVGQQTLEQLQILSEMLPSQRDFQALQNLDPVRQQRIIDELLRQFQDMPSGDEIRTIANMIQADQLTKTDFLNEIRRIIDSIPQQRSERVNLVKEEVGSSEKEGPPKSNLKPPTSGPPVFMPTEEDLKSFKQPLRSSIMLDNPKVQIGQIKVTFRQNPDLAEQLVDLSTGQPVNFEILTKTKNPKRGVYFGNTNIKDIFKAKFGSGMKQKMSSVKANMPKVGRGLSVKETPSYKEYGKYAIHIPQLEQQDLLNVKYKSLGQIPKFKPIPVSDIFRDFLLDLLESGKANQRVYTQIAPEERKYFEEMSIGAGVWNGLGLKRTTTNTDEEENKRFEILKGEYIAGNNNPKVISELRRLVVKMMSDGRIRKPQGVELLMELSI
jgi:hypothetical protein